MSNLKQIGLAFMMYSQDYDETMPAIAWSSGSYVWPGGSVNARNTWFLRIYPYVKSIQLFNCPSDDVVWTGWPTTKISYGMNANFFSTGGNRAMGVKLSVIEKPSQTLLVADSLESTCAEKYF